MAIGGRQTVLIRRQALCGLRSALCIGADQGKKHFDGQRVLCHLPSGKARVRNVPQWYGLGRSLRCACHRTVARL